MLHRFKLGTKLAFVVALGLVAIAAIAAVGYPTLQKVKIGSDASQQRQEYDQLVADIGPSSQYLGEPYLLANRIVREKVPAQQADLANRLRLSQASYESAHTQWADRLGADAALGDLTAVRDTLLVQSYTPAETFWRVAINDFLPAVEAGQTARAADLLDGSMTTAFNQHRSAIESAAALVQTQRALHDETVQAEINRRMRILLGTVAASTVIVALAGLLLTRSIRRPVQRLTAAVNGTAARDLSLLVAAMGNAKGDSPMPSLDPIVVDANDDLADLAHAFNSVRQTAVEMAGKQAATRRAISDVFVNMGRRNQALINRQLSLIDQLERGEENPDTLDDLFRLDHLATRMRRNAESLLVLAGAEPARRWTENVDVSNVLRSALSEIEEYNQVELGDIERVLLRGAVVADVAHLLAELLENATAFSPPTSRVRVQGRVFTEGYVVSIIDEGIGMDAAALAEANSRLASIERHEEAPSRVLGLYVVGRLAARHGIRVRLLDSPGHGITARVLLPVSAFETPPASQTPMRAIAVAAPRAFDDAISRLDAVAPTTMPTSAPVTSPIVPAGSVLPVPLHPVPVQPVPPVPVDTTAWDDEPGLGVSPPVANQPTAPPTSSLTASPLPTIAPGVAGLTKRVRGAQVPDTGPSRDDAVVPPRSADDVRALLTRFRAGVDRGLQNADAESGDSNEGNQS